MKRIWILGPALVVCGMSGCAGETREGLVTEVILRMNTASSDVSLITAKVNEATDDAKKGKPLDLAEAAKAAEKLKETGTDIVKIKQRIDMVRGSITDEEKKDYAENQKGKLNDAFRNLLEQKEKLRTALTAAEAFDKAKVDELRKKIVEAEGPFEQQARSGA